MRPLSCVSRLSLLLQVAGLPDSILRRNASMPYQPGFLQDPGRADFNALEFLWHNCYECACCRLPGAASAHHADSAHWVLGRRMQLCPAMPSSLLRRTSATPLSTSQAA